MAITKIYAITKNLWYSVAYASNEKKTGLDGVIDYAVNPDKTEQRLFQACINCKSTDTAYTEMQNVKNDGKKKTAYWDTILYSLSNREKQPRNRLIKLGLNLQNSASVADFKW